MSETISIYNQEQITAALIALNAAISKSWLISMPVWSLDYGDPRSLPEAGGTVAGELVGSEYLVEFRYPVERAGTMRVYGQTIPVYVTVSYMGGAINGPYLLIPPGESIYDMGAIYLPATVTINASFPFNVNIGFS